MIKSLLFSFGHSYYLTRGINFYYAAIVWITLLRTVFPLLLQYFFHFYIRINIKKNGNNYFLSQEKSSSEDDLSQIGFQDFLWYFVVDNLKKTKLH